MAWRSTKVHAMFPHRLEEIEAQAAQRAGTDGLVPVELYNCALEAAAAGGGWRAAVP